MGPENAQTQAHTKQELKLPVLVFGVVEVRRLRREIEMLDEFMRQSAIREPGQQPALPRVSRLLDALATDNSRNLLLDADRQELGQFLKVIEKAAPAIHVSFASDPSSAFVAKLVTWLRGNIHPTILLQIGLQPTIAAGCIVRTENKVFDLSLRQNLTDQRAKLIEALDSMDASRAAPQPAADATAASVNVTPQGVAQS